MGHKHEWMDAGDGLKWCALCASMGLDSLAATSTFPNDGNAPLSAGLFIEAFGRLVKGRYAPQHLVLNVEWTPPGGHHDPLEQGLLVAVFATISR